jgi:simple sugar transport system permease protein
MDLSGLSIPVLIGLTIASATPIALGAYAGLFSERSGVVNIAIEGMMLMSAMTAAFASAYLGSLFLGVIVGLLTGALMAAMHAVVSIKFRTDQIISGTVINFLAIGLTGHIYQIYLVPPQWPGSTGTFPELPIPVLSEIPILGPIFFNHQPVVYAMLVLTPIIHYIIFYTPWGLRIRSVGEHPRAADTVGINVYFMRYASVITGGFLAGLAGVWMTLEQVGTFQIEMTAGRGFIALAALIFGRWTPFGAFGAALIFGAAQTFQFVFQARVPEFPSQFASMLPYVLTIVVAAIARPIPPAAIGRPYVKE